MSPLDRAAHLGRWSAMPVAEKVFLALGMLVLAVALPTGPGPAVVAGVMTTTALVGARVPPRLWLVAATAPLGFLAVGVVALALRIDGRGLSLAPGFGVAAAMLASRSLAGIACLLFLALTTPTSDLIAGLRRVGIPAEVLDVALVMYRFTFVLAEAAAAMDAAQAARLGHATARHRMRSLGRLIANLLPRALDRAHRLEVGLAARGWRGELRVLSFRPRPSTIGLVRIAALLCAVAAVGVLA